MEIKLLIRINSHIKIYLGAVMAVIVW
jgi:hypothetical protein